MVRRHLWTLPAVLCTIFINPPTARSQDLSDQQKARILQRFPQLDRDGDGQLSSDELKTIRERFKGTQKGAERNGQQPSTPTKSNGPLPTHSDLKYGDHKNAVMDVWLADSKKPAPIVVAIHGGGFTGGDKSKFHGCKELQECLDNGVSFASINYRFRNQDPRGIRACLHDSARAIQFIRHQATEWNIDQSRVAAYGGSAGAGTTLWLACHKDLADPTSEDPVSRESTRLAVGGLLATQATYDVLQWPEFIPSQIKITPQFMKAQAKNLKSAYGVQTMDELDTDEGKQIRKELDMLAWMSSDDPPIWMKSNGRGGPVALGDQGHTNHHPEHVARLKKRADQVGMETVVIARAIGLEPMPEISMLDFFFMHLGVR